MKTESDRLLGSLKIIDAVINRLENTQFMIEENQRRDDEALKEAAHRKDEGLDEDLEADRREEARIENLEYRDECRKEREDDYWEPNEL